MKHTRLLAFILCLILCVPVCALSEDTANLATPAMDMSLEQAAKEGLLDESVLEEFVSEPFIPENVEKAVFGADDRKSVNPAQYPYSAIAYMCVEASCGCGWTGTGFMVSRYGLMTAAHCIVCTTHGKTANKITLYFGYRSSKDYSYHYNGATTYWYGTDFKNADGTYGYNGHTAWDYAYVLLQSPMGDKTGWFGTQARSDSHIKQDVYEVAGYRDGVLKTSKGMLTPHNDKELKYNIDTEPGYSGCPVFDATNYAVAINVAHTSTHNFARRIDIPLKVEMRKNGLFD